MTSTPSLRFGEAAELSFDRLVQWADRDWTVAAGSLDWSCRKTLGHLTDCVFGYAMQLAVHGKSDWLPFEELRLVDDAAAIDLLRAFRAIGRMFTGVLDDAPPDATASDGLIDLGPNDWSARGGYEVLLHTHDIVSGLGGTFEPPADLCRWVVESPNLWMLDRDRAAAADGPWEALLRASGR